MKHPDVTFIPTIGPNTEIKVRWQTKSDRDCIIHASISPPDMTGAWPYNDIPAEVEIISAVDMLGQGVVEELPDNTEKDILRFIESLEEEH